MPTIRRLDHVAIAVRSTKGALRHFRDHLGLTVIHSEELEEPRVRLTYLDVGNAFIQLVEPLDEEGDLAHWLAQTGEGLHHICFGVDDPLAAAASLGREELDVIRGTGRGRVSAFIPGLLPHGVRVECTEFHRRTDVDETPGWIPNV